MQKRPNRRIINKLLSRKIWGWNDKRKNHNRIKLTTKLNVGEMSMLKRELKMMFPTFSFTVEDYTQPASYQPCSWSPLYKDKTVTVIKYSEI